MSRIKGWLDLLRSVGRDAGSDVQELVEAEAHLWQSHQNATAAATGAMESTTALSAAVARNARALEELADGAKHAQGRTDEASASLSRVMESIERLRLVALNVGLEGSRMGDAAGRALAAVSDELRGLVEQGTEAARDVQTIIEELRPAMGATTGRAEQLRKADQEVAGHVSRAQTHAQECAQSVEEIGEWARRLAETDPETAVILARAADHVRALVADLSQLKNATQYELARAVLRPLIEPLSRLLKDIGGGAHA